MFRTRRWVFLAALALAAPATAQPLPLLANLGVLGLSVAGAGTAASISDGIQTQMTARPGARLVIVTLRGRARKPCRIAYEAREFAAIYETRPAHGGPQPDVQIQLSAAIAEGMGNWVMLAQGAVGATLTVPIRRAGLVTLRVAFLLPQDVTSFQVRFPTTAGGRASVAAPGRRR